MIARTMKTFREERITDMNDKSTWIAWAITNSVTVICFAALAIFFGKWWILLISVFFTSSVKTEETHKPLPYRICDRCGDFIYPDNGDNSSFEEQYKAAGWIRCKSGDKWEDICPRCQRKEVYEDALSPDF